MYSYLFTVIVAICVVALVLRRDSKLVSALMAVALFLVVALRGPDVGPDTKKYLFFFRFGSYGTDTRDFEPLFEYFNQYLLSLGLSDRMFLIICAVLSIGIVLYTIWKASSFKILSVALLLACFQWSFYLTGIRQGIAMGFFALGVYLMQDFYQLRSFRDFKIEAQIKTVLAAVLMMISVFFHTTALFAVLIFIVVFFFRADSKFYLIAIAISFVVAIYGAFTSIGEVMESMFDIVEGRMSMADRYEGYLNTKDSFSEIPLYLMLKDLLPFNVIAVACLIYNRDKKYTVYEHLYFWLVIAANLLHSFSYMFRMRQYLYPMAAVAVATLMFPILKRRKLSTIIPVTLLIAYVILSAIVTYVILIAMDEYNYTFLG